MQNESKITEFIIENKRPFCEDQQGKIFSLFYFYEQYRYYKPQVTGLSEKDRQRLLPKLPSYPESYPVHKEDYYDKEFVERMDVAEHSLNQLGLVHLRHQFPHREESISDNSLIFEVVSAEFMNVLYRQQVNGVCEAWRPSHLIVCQNDRLQFKYYGAGILIHEVFHLLDIPHLHEINREETNQLLIYNPSSKEGYSFINRGIIYTPLSLFSIMHAHLPHEGIHLNETRVQELLVNFHFSSHQITCYFSLLESFGGRNKLLTYQDIQLLAQAVYTLSPTSLMGRKLQLPDYYLIDAVYSPAYQKKQIIELINAFKGAENFTYSLLAQNDLLLELIVNTPFTTNLINEFKMVSLSDQIIHCFLNNSINFLNISDDCILQANVPHATEFNLTISIDDTYNKIQCTLNLIVKNPLKLLLLGRSQLIYDRHNITVDLSYLCAAVAYPVHDEFQCEIEDLPEGWLQNDCSVIRKQLQNQNISVTFFNSAVNKTCQIQFIPRAEKRVLSHSLENNTLSEHSLSVNQSINTSEIISYWPEIEYSVLNESINSSAIRYTAYWQNPYIVNESQFTKNLINHAHLSELISEQLIHHLKHIFYITGIPILQGVFEGAIDETQLSATKKSILKLVPRIGLISLGYFSSLQIPILLFYSLSECLISKHLIEKQRIGINHLLNGLLFLIITELEYGFSNLWELSDKLEFWPELSARFNQLVLQFLFAPALKSASYLTTLICLKFIHSNNKQEQNEQDMDKIFIDNRGANLASNDCSFFNSLSNAVSVVFSKKIFRLPSLFVREISDNLSGREGQNPSKTYASK